ncbi:MAG: hypothetical protein IJC39_00415, partial [Firmicutes bacterium]|nr:hypothetical protein [Bacillota bacterium]
MKKRFSEIFGGFTVSAEAEMTLEAAYIIDLHASRESRSLEITVLSEKILPECSAELFKSDLLNQVPGLNEVIINYRYELPDTFSSEELLSAYRPNLEYFISSMSPICGAIIKNASWKLSDEAFELTVKDKGADYLKHKNTAALLKKKLYDETGKKFDFIIKEDAKSNEHREEYLKQIAEEEKRFAEQIMSMAKQTASENNKPEVSAQDKVILGKNITGEAVDVPSARLPGERVIISGRIFDLDKREIKGDKYIVSFNLTDMKDSISVIFFISQKKFAETIEPRL